MKKNKIILCIGGIIILMLAIAIYDKSRTVKCTITNEPYKGFTNTEKVSFKLGGKTIKNIKMSRSITLNDFYDSYGTYYESLLNVFDVGYSYVDKKKYKSYKKGKSIYINFSTKKGGIVLDNLSITGTNEYENTSLRFDVANDLENSSNSFRIKDKYTKKSLKEAVSKLGYSCD